MAVFVDLEPKFAVVEIYGCVVSWVVHPGLAGQGLTAENIHQSIYKYI